MSTEEWMARNEALTKETDAIEERMMMAICMANNEKFTRTYVRNHHRTTIILSNTLLKYLPEEEARKWYQPEPSSPLIVLCRKIYHKLQQLRDYLAEHYCHYLPKLQLKPKIQELAEDHELEQRMNRITTMLSAKGAGRKLIDIVSEPVRHYLQQRPGCRGAKKLSYLRIYTCTLLELAAKEDDAAAGRNISKEIIRTLFYLNLNSPSFINYYMQLLQRKLSQADTMEQRLEWLKRIRKMMNRRHVSPEGSYKRELPGIKELVTDWLEQEQYELYAGKVPGNKASDEDGTYKLPTALSVPQIGFWLRIFHDMKLIKPVFKMPMFRFFAAHMSSMQQEHISDDSLKKKFESPQRPAIDAVLDMLFEMINYVKKRWRS